MTNHYELLYLVPATQTEEELIPIRDEVKRLINKLGGAITLENSMGKHKLAYPIKHARYGYYLLYEFDLPGEQLKDLNRELGLLTGLLRHQIVRREVSVAALKRRAQRTERVAAAQARAQTALPSEAAKPADEKDKIRLEDLDDKLDELLEGDIKML